MKHSAFLMIALFALSSVTYAGQQAELRSYDPKATAQISSDELLIQADKCWNQSGVHEEHTIWQDRDGKLSLALRKFGNCYMSITIPVKAVNESCEGIQTLAFVVEGQSTFAAGKITNGKGQFLGSLFSRYEGRASGAALIAGVGRWKSTSSKDISIEGSIGAIPLPIMGGNVGLGYTSCETSFELAPEKTEAEIFLSIRQGGQTLIKGKRTIPLEQIMNLSL